LQEKNAPGLQITFNSDDNDLKDEQLN